MTAPTEVRFKLFFLATAAAVVVLLGSPVSPLWADDVDFDFSDQPDQPDNPVNTPYNNNSANTGYGGYQGYGSSFSSADDFPSLRAPGQGTSTSTPPPSGNADEDIFTPPHNPKSPLAGAGTGSRTGSASAYHDDQDQLPHIGGKTAAIHGQSVSEASPSSNDSYPYKGRILSVGLGGEGGYVHSFQANPQNSPQWDMAGKEGLGGGGGFILNTRFFRFIGLETGLVFDHTTRHKSHTFSAQSDSGQVTFNRYPTVITNNMRIPIMVKLISPIPVWGREIGNIWLSCGPEWVIPLSVYGQMDHQITASDGIRYNENELEMMAATNQAAYMNRIREREAMHLTAGFGFGINLGASELGLGIKASWNYNHDNQYMDAFCINQDTSTCVGEEFEYSDHTLDVRAVARLLYNIPIL